MKKGCMQNSLNQVC